MSDEQPDLPTSSRWDVGLVASWAGLRLVAALSGRLARCRPRGRSRLRAIGAVVALAGIALVARGASANPAAQVSTPDDTARHRAIDEYVTRRMRSAHIPGFALAIVRGDRVVYLKGYGRADESGRPVTPQTPFMIGSVTKSFTALAVMQLVEAGSVDLDAPVQRYIPWFRVADRHASGWITVRHLLTMTSGLPQSYETQMWTDLDDGALERTVRFLATTKLSHPVGESYSYSNANYETLGLVVQSVSGRSYEDYVRERIFAPLDMRNSFVSQAEAERHGMASGYRWWFGFPVPVTLPYRRAELPAGYIIASAEDMAHYVIAQMNAGRYREASVLSPDGIAAIHAEPAPHTYGFGWESVRVDGHRLIDLDGGTADFQSSLFFDPEARVGVFVAANVINALDAFASPPGSSRLDGATLRGMAQTILSLELGRPRPGEGPGHERLTLLFDLVLLALTGVLVLALSRMPARYHRLAQRDMRSRSELVRYGAIAALENLAVPAAMLWLALGVPAWRVVALFQPDLAYWAYAVAIVLAVKALVELTLAGRLFARARPPHAQPAAWSAGD